MRTDLHRASGGGEVSQLNLVAQTGIAPGTYPTNAPEGPKPLPEAALASSWHSSNSADVRPSIWPRNVSRKRVSLCRLTERCSPMYLGFPYAGIIHLITRACNALPEAWILCALNIQSQQVFVFKTSTALALPPEASAIAKIELLCGDTPASHSAPCHHSEPRNIAGPHAPLAIFLHWTRISLSSFWPGRKNGSSNHSIQPAAVQSSLIVPHHLHPPT